MEINTDGEKITFCTLGMFIIDEIEYRPPKPPNKNVFGGGGSYAAIGARIATSPEAAKSVGWIVDAGSDFPEEFRTLIQSWGTSCWVREDSTRLTTRAWNGYGENEERTFKYLTPKIQLNQNSLPSSHLLAKAFHLICSPKRCVDLVHGILERREEIQHDIPRPYFVWEPFEGSCSPDELQHLYRASRLVDTVSPNAGEFAALYGQDHWGGLEGTGKSMVDDLIRSGIGPDKKGCLVLRAGKDGCWAFGSDLGGRHLPAYHSSQSSSQEAPKVIDPTGGGNAFLGALAQCMVSKDTVGPHLTGLPTEDGEEIPGGLFPSLIDGTVAASFAIEQVGMPILSKDSDGQELWNGEKVIDRIYRYLRRNRKEIKESQSKFSETRDRDEAEEGSDPTMDLDGK